MRVALPAPHASNCGRLLEHDGLDPAIRELDGDGQSGKAATHDSYVGLGGDLAVVRYAVVKLRLCGDRVCQPLGWRVHAEGRAVARSGDNGVVELMKQLGARVAQNGELLRIPRQRALHSDAVGPKHRTE